MLVKPTPGNLVRIHPNPFTERTLIKFEVRNGNSHNESMPLSTRLAIYNADGRLVKVMVNKQLMPGRYEINWNGKDYSGKEVHAGLYFYEFIVNGKKEYGTVIYSVK